MGYCIEKRHAHSLLVMGRESFSTGCTLVVQDRVFGPGFGVSVLINLTAFGGPARPETAPLSCDGSMIQHCDGRPRKTLCLILTRA